MRILLIFAELSTANPTLLQLSVHVFERICAPGYADRCTFHLVQHIVSSNVALLYASLPAPLPSLTLSARQCMLKPASGHPRQAVNRQHAYTSSPALFLRLAGTHMGQVCKQARML